MDAENPDVPGGADRHSLGLNKQSLRAILDEMPPSILAQLNNFRERLGKAKVMYEVNATRFWGRQSTKLIDVDFALPVNPVETDIQSSRHEHVKLRPTMVCWKEEVIAGLQAQQLYSIPQSGPSAKKKD